MITDDDLFHRYYHNYATRFNASATCEGACKSQKICSSSYYNFDEVVYCMEEWEEIEMEEIINNVNKGILEKLISN